MTHKSGVGAHFMLNYTRTRLNEDNDKFLYVYYKDDIGFKQEIALMC